jgi:hypothetical protein
MTLTGMRHPGPGGGSQNLSISLKRARDRRAQQAMRDRAKAENAALREEVLQLSERLRQTETANSHELTGYIRENHDLRQRLADLERHQPLPTPQYKQTTHTWRRIEDSRVSKLQIALDRSILESLVLQKPNPNVLSGDRLHPLHGRSPYEGMPPSREPDHCRVSLHVPPSNPSDRIVQPFLEKMRAQVMAQGVELASASPRADDHGSQKPILIPSAVQVEVSQVIADIIFTYSEFETVSKKLACIMTATASLTVWPHLPTLSM